MKAGTENILVYRLGSLGDTVVALPALHWLRAKFPGARITLLTNCPVNGRASPASAILESTGLVDDYLAYPLATRNPGALLHLRRAIAQRRFHTVFALAEARGWSKSLRDWFFFKSCRIPRVVGSALRRRDLACRPCAASNGYESEAGRLVRRVGAEGRIDLEEDRWWDLYLSSQERNAAAQILAEHRICGGFIVLSLGTKVDVNDWTLPNWRRLVEALGRKYSHLGLIGLGVAQERQSTDVALGLWPGNQVNLCGSLSPRISAAVLERAAVFIGHDSGPMHLAAAVGTKCVAIFSARNPPGQWFPRGAGHQVLYHRTECFKCGLSICRRHAKKCILGISVAEVLAAIERVLKRGRQIQGAAGRTFVRERAGCARIKG